MGAVIPPTPSKQWKPWQLVVGVIRRLPFLPEWLRKLGEAGAAGGIWPNRGPKP